MIGWAVMEQRKTEIDISTDESQRPIFAVYGLNGTEFSYKLFLVTTEFENGKTAQYGSRITAT